MSCLSSLPNNCRSRVYNEKPAGLFNNVNVVFQTAKPFVAGSLIVRLDGVALDPSQYSVGSQTFTLNVNPADPKALNSPPRSDECLRVDYDVASANSCLTIL